MIEFFQRLTLAANKKNNMSKDKKNLRQVSSLEELISRPQSIIVNNKNEIIGIHRSDTNDVVFSEISRHVKLKYLILFGNNIIEINFLKNLIELEYLNISSNRIQEIDTLRFLTKLKYLNLSFNYISNISPISNLIFLEYCYLPNNQIVDVRPLRNLTAIKILHLASNQITNIKSILPILRLAEKLNLNFILANNPIDRPPIEILNQNRSSIIDWFEAKKELLEEIKIILIGDPKSGKTSLLRRLISNTFENSEVQTDGINIEHLKFSDSPIFQKALSLRTITGHFWDFGGQEILNSTHQLFLTNRTIYMLVLDARNDVDISSQIRLWVKKIKSTGGDSPIIIVGNQIDVNSSFGISNSYEIRKEFKQITSIVMTSCKTGEGFEDLIEALEATIPRTELFNMRIDKKWISIKRELEVITLNDFFIPESSFSEICNKHQLTDVNGKKNLIKFLHDLGLVLHFDQFNLSEYFILNPYWITYGLYQILTSKHAADSKGYVKMNDLDYIINFEDDKDKIYQVKDYRKIKYSIGQCRFLTDILFQFKLCFYLPDHSSFILPELLSTDEPTDFTMEIRKNTVEKIKFAYIYEYLPRSILPAIMVGVDSKMTKFWRTGILMEHDKCLGLITTYENNLKIEIIGDYKNKRILLGAIRILVDNINSQLTSLPLKVIPETINDYEFLINYDEILDKEKNREKIIVQYRPFKAEFKIQKLLEGIDDQNITAKSIENKLDEILDKQKKHEVLLQQQLDYIFNNKSFVMNKVHLEDIINKINKEQSAQIIFEIENFLTEVVPLANDDLSDRFNEIYSNFQSSNSEFKLKFSVPLIKVLGIDVEYKYDVKKWIGKMYTKYGFELFKLMYL